MKTSTRLVAPVLCALTISVALPAGGHAATGPMEVPGTAGAATVTGTPEPTRPEFYEPPRTIPSTPGTIIRTEAATFLLDPLDLSSTVVTATRVMYSSTDSQGRPIAVTGTVFVPKTSYVGKSKRPLISYTPGTQGIGDRCAPSRQMAEFVEYEGPGIARTVGRGYAVAMTDYQGLGTPGTHTYLNREAEGRAALDMARAAKNLEGAGLDDTNPVGLMGYSQGGQAAGAAAELAGTYAPDLDVKGSAVGAPPADLRALLKNLDSGFYTGFATFAMLGMAQNGEFDPRPHFNAKGRALLDRTEDACTTDLLEYSFKDSAAYTASGQPFSDLIDEQPYRTTLDAQRLGRRTPNAPVVINHAIGDDVVPYGVGKQLGSDWCDKGTRVSFNAGLVPTHIGGYLPHLERSMAFFEKRFAGQNQTSSCWRL